MFGRVEDTPTLDPDHLMSTPNIHQTALLALGNAQTQLIATNRGSDIDLPRFHRTTDAMNYVFSHAHILSAVVDEMNDILANLESKVSPSSKKKRHTAERNWTQLVQGIEPSIRENEVWNEEIVKKYYAYMLPLMVSLIYSILSFTHSEKYCLGFQVKITRGTKGRPHIKASTLNGYKEAFVWAIAKHTTDTDGNHCGSLLLSRGGILSNLEDAVFTRELCIYFMLIP